MTAPHTDLVSIAAGDLEMGIPLELAEKLVEEFFPGDEPMAPTLFHAEVPAHRVKVAAFRLGRTEVTHAQFKAFVDAGGYRNAAHWKELVDAAAPGTDRGGFDRVNLFVDTTGKPGPVGWANGTFPAGKADHPVEGVSYFEAAAYAHWAGARLPTEAEWEWAARGKDGRMFVWGNDRKLVWEWNGRQDGDSTAVGAIAHDKTPAGIVDLARNVSEWCADRWATYPKSPAGEAPPDEAYGVVRGGNYLSTPDELRAPFRRRLQRLERKLGVGFRLAQNG